ncbi:Uncharacterized protein APZ42_002427, partial [Daphnia magna]
NDFRFVALCQIKNCFTPCFVILFPDLSSQVVFQYCCKNHLYLLISQNDICVLGCSSTFCCQLTWPQRQVATDGKFVMSLLLGRLKSKAVARNKKKYIIKNKRS